MNYVAIGDNCTIPDVTHNTATGSDANNADVTTSSNPAVVAAPSPDADGAVNPLTALSVGVTEVVVANAAGATQGTYRITVIAAPSLSVNIKDSDNIVSNKAPAPAMEVIARGFSTQQAVAATGVTVSVNGIYFQRDGAVTSFVSEVEEGTGSNLNGFTYAVTDSLNIAGAAAGDYTITASIPAAGAAVAPETAARKAVSGTGTLTIGDPGTSPNGATLSLGKVTPDNPTTVVDESVPESGSKPSTQTINVVYSISNSLGNTANSSDLSTVQVIAPQGAIVNTGATVTGTAKAESSENADDAVVLTPTGSFTVGSAGNRAGTVEVWLIATGAGGVAQSNKLTLTFTGGAGSIELGDASGSLLNVNQADDSRDEITFGFSTKDSAGNAIKNRQNLSVVITDPDGTAVSVGTPDSSGRIDWEQGDAPGARAGSYNQITLTSNGSIPKPLATGEYMLKINSGALSTTAMFVVAGKADSVTIDVGETNDNGEFEITVMAMDADGNAVADGTLVNIEAADLRGDGDKVLFLARSDGKTKAGAARATLVEIGPGNAAIVVTVDSVTKVQRYTSAYGAEEPEAMPEEEAGLSCLSSLSGFSTWTCDVEASASEIFDWISSRGATALHLNSNRMWVRYSVVDGAMVPGSSDFMVTKSDILYISN